jgi:hypothetical protein
MIRGHIDFASRTRVEGWMYSDQVPLAGKRIQAFVDEDCVGAGVIDVFRQDLVDASLGDGVAGFSFSIHLRPSHNPKSVDVRLDGSNAMIRHVDARLVPREEIDAGRRRVQRDPLSLSWMLSRGWLTQEHYNALRLLEEFGVYRQRLLIPIADKDDPAYRAEIARGATTMLEFHMSLSVTASERADISPGELLALRRELHAEFPAIAPVIGLWAPQLSCLNVVEGSHLGAPVEKSGGGIDYDFDCNHLLWLNLDSYFCVKTAGIRSAVTAFIPCRSEAGIVVDP